MLSSSSTNLSRGTRAPPCAVSGMSTSAVSGMSTCGIVANPIVAALARFMLPNLPPVRARIIGLPTRVERAPTMVMPSKAGCERGVLAYLESISAP